MGIRQADLVCVVQVVVGELIICRSLHNNLTNALASALHFILDAIAAFFVAILVQRVRVLSYVLLGHLAQAVNICCGMRVDCRRQNINLVLSLDRGRMM